MGFISEFKKFAMRGNVIDLAVGVVIGAAFNKIVSSLVDDILTPAILTPVLNAAHLNNLAELRIPGTAIKYGNFISNILSFVVMAFALFMVIKMINRMNKKEEAIAEPSGTDKLLTEIRDLLAEKK